MQIKEKVEIPKKGWAESIMNNIIWGKSYYNPNYKKMDEILQKNPTSSINNSRSIIRKKLESYNKYPSESKAQNLENLTGIDPDFHEVVEDKPIIEE